MSSNELSGASAEATETNPASTAASSFGSTRGSGLARGKGKRPSAPAAASAASAAYTPTAIEVLTAPREYQNPFAPVETPAAVTPESAPVASAIVSTPAPAPVPAPVAYVAPVQQPAAKPYITPDETPETPASFTPSAPSAPVARERDVQASLNILPPEQQKSVPAQTWESEGFKPAREPRADRPRREESRREDAPRREERSDRPARQEIPTPEKFLYVRPGFNYVPTPSTYTDAPRSSNAGSSHTPAASRPAAAAPASASYSSTPAASTEKSGGSFFGWLKSLFVGAPDPAPVVAETRRPEQRSSERYQGNRPRPQGGAGGPAGDGQRRRSRGRGRSQRGGGGEYRNGGDQGGSSAT